MKNICYYININPQRYYDLGIQSLEKYCTKHGIDMCSWEKIDDRYTHKEYNKVQNIWYQKIAVLEDFINSDYDNFMLVDLDMMFNSNAPNIFDEIKGDYVYQQYAPNVMEKNPGIEVGNGGLFLFNRNVATKILPELDSDKLDLSRNPDQINFAYARDRANIPFKKLDDKWNYTIWSLSEKKIVQKFINNEVYFIHYGNVNSKKMYEHLRNKDFKNIAL